MAVVTNKINEGRAWGISRPIPQTYVLSDDLFFDHDAAFDVIQFFFIDLF